MGIKQNAARIGLWLLALTVTIVGIALTSARQMFQPYPYEDGVGEIVDLLPIGIALLAAGLVILAAALILEVLLPSRPRPHVEPSSSAAGTPEDSKLTGGVETASSSIPHM